MAWQKVETWICLVLPLMWALSNGAHGLNCNFCQSVNNYSSCLQAAGSVACTEALVNVTHLLMAAHNPSLGAVSPASEFRCFQVNYTVNGAMNYQMGCTYASSHICQGWTTLAQCKIVNGTAVPAYGPPSSPNAPGPSRSSTTPRANTPNVPSSFSPSATPTRGSGSTTTTTSSTTKQDVALSTVKPTSDNGMFKFFSRASIVTFRFEVLLPLILLLVWCQSS